MRRSLIGTACTAFVLAISTSAYASTPDAALIGVDAAVATPGGELQIHESAASGNTSMRSLTGSFSRGLDLVTVQGASTSPVQAAASLEVNGKRFSVTRDLRTGEAAWRADGVTLVPEDREVLRAFDAVLRDRWAEPALEQQEGLPQHQDLVFRLVMLAAEAPLGVLLTEQQVPRPEVSSVEKALPASTALSTVAAVTSSATLDPVEAAVLPCMEDVAAVTPAGSAERSAGMQACQGSDEDGILYFGSCSTYNRTTVHDAGGHCILWESIYSGPASTDCQGECGPGCAGLNIYTYDCGDHDRCGRVHGGSTNPWDSECGDEYFEADDDFLWGWPNCW